jgi:hypothetical protein
MHSEVEPSMGFFIRPWLKNQNQNKIKIVCVCVRSTPTRHSLDIYLNKIFEKKKQSLIWVESQKKGSGEPEEGVGYKSNLEIFKNKCLSSPQLPAIPQHPAENFKPMSSACGRDSAGRGSPRPGRMRTTRRRLQCARSHALSARKGCRDGPHLWALLASRRRRKVGTFLSSLLSLWCVCGDWTLKVSLYEANEKVQKSLLCLARSSSCCFPRSASACRLPRVPAERRVGRGLGWEPRGRGARPRWTRPLQGMRVPGAPTWLRPKWSVLLSDAALAGSLGISCSQPHCALWVSKPHRFPASPKADVFCTVSGELCGVNARGFLEPVGT